MWKIYWLHGSICTAVCRCYPACYKPYACNCNMLGLTTCIVHEFHHTSLDSFSFFHFKIQLPWKGITVCVHVCVCGKDGGRVEEELLLGYSLVTTTCMVREGSEQCHYIPKDWSLLAHYQAHHEEAGKQCHTLQANRCGNNKASSL